jgi:hypothetical protein
MVQKHELQRTLKQLEKEVYKSHSLLHEFTRLQHSLDAINEQSSKLEAMAESPGLEKDLREELKSTELISKFKELDSKLSHVRQNLQAFERPKFRTSLFLESHASTESFTFPSKEEGIAFLQEAFHVHDLKTILIGPAFIGAGNYAFVAESLALHKVSPQYWELPVKQFKKACKSLDAVATHTVLECSSFKVTFTSFNTLKIRALPETLRDLKKLI